MKCMKLNWYFQRGWGRSLEKNQLQLGDIYVDDALTIMPSKTSANVFPETLNHCHSLVEFTTEMENNDMFPFLGTVSKSTYIKTNYEKSCR